MKKFTKHNNPSKKNRPRKMSRTGADIYAARAAFLDTINGRPAPLAFYDEISDHASGNPSRGIYNDERSADA